MANQTFIDENSATTIMGAGSAGSFEFGSAAPSVSAVCTVDGTPLNNGARIGDALVAPNANSRITGSVFVTSGNAVTISTGKGTYALAACDRQDLGSGIDAVLVGSFDVRQYRGAFFGFDITVNYAYL